MTSQRKVKRSQTPESGPSAVPSGAEYTAANHTQIGLRAYEIYLERGGISGNELDHWLQAERELEKR